MKRANHHTYDAEGSHHVHVDPEDEDKAAKNRSAIAAGERAVLTDLGEPGGDDQKDLSWPGWMRTQRTRRPCARTWKRRGVLVVCDALLSYGGDS